MKTWSTIELKGNTLLDVSLTKEECMDLIQVIIAQLRSHDVATIKLLLEKHI